MLVMSVCVCVRMFASQNYAIGARWNAVEMYDPGLLVQHSSVKLLTPVRLFVPLCK